MFLDNFLVFSLAYLYKKIDWEAVHKTRNKDGTLLLRENPLDQKNQFSSF